MRNINHTDLEQYISTARLNTYRSFFNPSNDVELFGCYLWSKEIAAAFFPLIQVFEITLRNSIHKEAKSHLGSFWFDNLGSKPRNNRTAAESHAVQNLTNSLSSTRRDLRRELHLPSTASVNEDRIIAKLTFGFWTTLFNSAFDVNRHPRTLWPALLRPVFPNTPRRHTLSRHDVQNKLQTIRSFRNKAFHHEPIWNIGRPPTVQDSLNRLHSNKDLFLNLMYWMSKDSVELVKRAGYIHEINRVCSLDHLQYLMNPGGYSLPLSRVKREFRKLLKEPNKTTDITINRSPAGKLLTIDQ